MGLEQTVREQVVIYQTMMHPRFEQNQPLLPSNLTKQKLDNLLFQHIDEAYPFYGKF